MGILNSCILKINNKKELKMYRNFMMPSFCGSCDPCGSDHSIESLKMEVEYCLSDLGYDGNIVFCPHCNKNSPK